MCTSINGNIHAQIRGQDVSRRRQGTSGAQPKLIQAVTPLQTLDPALGVNHALFAGIKGVALAAQLHAHGGLSGPGVKHVATGASYDRVIKLGVNVCFHDWIPVNLDLQPEPRPLALIAL